MAGAEPPTRVDVLALRVIGDRQIHHDAVVRRDLRRYRSASSTAFLNGSSARRWLAARARYGISRPCSTDRLLAVGGDDARSRDDLTAVFGLQRTELQVDQEVGAEDRPCNATRIGR